MAGEWFRAVRYRAFLGIARNDPTRPEGTYGLAGLDRVLSEAGVLSRLRPLLDAHTTNEPLHVALRDRGFTDPKSTPPVLMVDLAQIQIDAGFNEIPRATCAVPIGRAIFDPAGKRPSVIGGASDREAASIIHILERYLTRHVPARIFIECKTVATAGEDDPGDNLEWPDEPMVLFDGILTGPTHQASGDNGIAVLHLVHFLAGLTFSSSLSGQVAAGGTIPAAFATGPWYGLTAGATTSMTVYGAVAAGLAGGKALYTDFWGYQIPERTRTGGDGEPVKVPPSVGVKGFLTQLADTELFNWSLVDRADFGGSFCDNKTLNQLKNNQALGALGRIEPIWPDWAGIGEAVPIVGINLGGDIAASVWTSVQQAIETAPGRDTSPVDRAAVLAQAGDIYTIAGYRYGMPISFYLTGTSQLAPFAMSRAFAQDITGATFVDLNAASFWELLAGRYAGRYQIGIAPMADRAVVMPAAPILVGVWQIVHRSEIFTWTDDVQIPIPVRGVLLAADRMSGTGALLGGYRPFEAGYDSCQPGVFVTREMPAWLITAYSAPGINAGSTVQFGVKATASAPWLSAPLAAAAGGGLVTALHLGNPDTTDKSTAAKLAQSLWQQERLRYRSVFFSGRFRVDIAPGSTITAELPSDRYVRKALDTEIDGGVQGLVLRVTHSIDCEADQATTSFQLGFVRMNSETEPGQPLFARRHPFWRTACYGAPWCDSKFFRETLGDSATIAEATQ